MKKCRSLMQQWYGNWKCARKKKYVFSDKFRKRMKRLIQKEKYMYAEKQLKKITQKIAAAAVVMLVGALTVTMSVEAYRVRFFIQ